MFCFCYVLATTFIFIAFCLDDGSVASNITSLCSGNQGCGTESQEEDSSSDEEVPQPKRSRGRERGRGARGQGRGGVKELVAVVENQGGEVVAHVLMDEVGVEVGEHEQLAEGVPEELAKEPTEQQQPGVHLCG